MGRTNNVKKKKGPKGKKAREKAKKDRQWGEEINPKLDAQQQGTAKRKGKSRLLTGFPTKKKPRTEPTSPTQTKSSATANYGDVNVMSHDDSSSSGSDNDGEYSGERRDDNDTENKALSSFLSTIITKRSKSRKRNLDESDDDDDSQNSDDDGDESAEEKGDGLDENLGNKKNLHQTVMLNDYFATRFHRSPSLSETNQQQSRTSTTKQQKLMTKFPVSDPSSTKTNNNSIFELLCTNKKLLQTLQLLPGSDKTKNNDDNSSDIRDWKRWCEAKAVAMQEARKGWSLTHTALNAGHNKRRTSLLLPPLLTSYHDVLWTTDGDDRRCRQNTQTVLCQHVAEHVWRSRSLIGQHNREISSSSSSASINDDGSDNNDGAEAEAAANKEDEAGEDRWRDQGYCRSTVLVLLPTRGTCHKFVKELLEMLPCQHQVKDNANHKETMARFEAEFGPDEKTAEDENEDEKTRGFREKVLARKGKDWLELFGDDVNDDDDFKFGLSINPRKPKKKKSDADNLEDRCDVRLYSGFYKSDIIFASPLGLKMATTNEEGETAADFLSSIEMCIISRADVMLMQNWDHVNDILGLLNLQPKESNDTDFSRVRQYALAGQSANWRQLVITSSFTDPMLLSTMKRFSTNFQGYARVSCPTPPENAALNKVLLPVRQVFQRIQCKSLASQANDRVEYFCEKILPQILRHEQKHTMVYIPSYFDFVSLRNILLEREINFCSVTEYSRNTEVSRGRARFLQGRKPILLYTGRAHYFLRHRIRGVRHLVFLGLPEHAQFYTDHVNAVNEGLTTSGGDDVNTSATFDDGAEDVASCLALYTKYDAHALERIVGAANCRRMQGEKSSFIFSSS